MQPCDTSKYNCGHVIPSSCVPYTGPDLTILPDPTSLACNANINDVFTIFDTTVKGILTGQDLTALNPRCLTFAPATVTVNQLFQTQIDKICALDASLTTLTTQVNNLNIGSQPITIDLLCLAPAAAPCESPTNIYSLLAVLNTIVNEVCALKTAVGI